MSKLDQQFQQDLKNLSMEDECPACLFSEMHFIRAFEDPDTFLEEVEYDICAKWNNGSILSAVRCLKKTSGEFDTAVIVDKRYPEIHGMLVNGASNQPEKVLILREMKLDRLIHYINKYEYSFDILPKEIRILVDKIVLTH